MNNAVDYASTTTPLGYVCADCGARGCKLWREYQTFLEHQVLRCAPCAGKSQKTDVSSMDAAGRRAIPESESRPLAGTRTDQIGWLVPAVPTPDGASYWGYTSVPEAGCAWWRALPLASTDGTR
jgi:hypothetical protein